MYKKVSSLLVLCVVCVVAANAGQLRVHPDGYVFVNDTKVRMSVVMASFPGFALPAGAKGLTYNGESVVAYDGKKEWTVDAISPTYNSILAAHEMLAAEESAAAFLESLPEDRKKVVGGVAMPKTPAELALADFTNNAAIYAYQNAFLLLCDAVSRTNTHKKLSFEELPALLKPLKKADKPKYEDIKDALLVINMALLEKAGTRWWKDCVWVSEPSVVATGQQIYNSLVAE